MESPIAAPGHCTGTRMQEGLMCTLGNSIRHWWGQQCGPLYRRKHSWLQHRFFINHTMPHAALYCCHEILPFVKYGAPGETWAHVVLFDTTKSASCEARPLFAPPTISNVHPLPAPISTFALEDELANCNCTLNSGSPTLTSPLSASGG